MNPHPSLTEQEVVGGGGLKEKQQRQTGTKDFTILHQIKDLIQETRGVSRKQEVVQPLFQKSQELPKYKTNNT